MKAYASIAFLFIFLMLLLGSAGPAKACQRSRISVDSISMDINFNIYIRFETGGGLSGATPGASGPTLTFAFAFYGSPTLAPMGFTPSITSDCTQVTNPGIAVASVFGSQFTIAYVSFGSPYTCINSTAVCGNAHTDIKQVWFEVTEVPDSIRLLGIEGNGSPFAGCFPDPDMVVNWIPLPVEWGSFEAEIQNEGVELEWATVHERNNAFFEVEHSTDGIAFSSLGVKEAVGFSHGEEVYTFTDLAPRKGKNHYRIRQVDINGNSSTSEVRSVSFAQENEMQWVAKGHNPVAENLQLQFYAPAVKHFNVQVFDQKGMVVFSVDKECNVGVNGLELDLSGLPAGVFHLLLRSEGQILRHKILKMH